MQEKYELALEVVHEAMRDALITASTGARVLGAIDVTGAHNNQLLDTLADCREKYKPVVQGMKMAEALAVTLDVIFRKVAAEDPPAPLFADSEPEPAGAPDCFRCGEPVLSAQEVRWAVGPEEMRVKIHAPCATPADEPEADGQGLSDEQAARVAGAEPGAVKDPKARRPKLQKQSAKKKGYRMARV